MVMKTEHILCSATIFYSAKQTTVVTSSYLECLVV